MAKRKQSQRARRSATVGAKGQRRRRDQRERRAASAAAAHRLRSLTVVRGRELERRFADLLWPALITIVFAVLGTLYFARSGPVVEHRPSLWASHDDLLVSLTASSAFVHGHLSSVYGHGLLAFPGSLVLFVPIAIFSESFSTTLVKISTVKDHLVTTSTTAVIRTVILGLEVPGWGARLVTKPSVSLTS